MPRFWVSKNKEQKYFRKLGLNEKEKQKRLGIGSQKIKNRKISGNCVSIERQLSGPTRKGALHITQTRQLDKYFGDSGGWLITIVYIPYARIFLFASMQAFLVFILKSIRVKFSKQHNLKHCKQAQKRWTSNKHFEKSKFATFPMNMLRTE